MIIVGIKTRKYGKSSLPQVSSMDTLCLSYTLFVNVRADVNLTLTRDLFLRYTIN